MKDIEEVVFPGDGEVKTTKKIGKVKPSIDTVKKTKISKKSDSPSEVGVKYKSKKVGDIKDRVVDNSKIIDQLKKELEMENPNPDSIRRLRKHENDELLELITLAKTKEK
jgi:hypothetical protein